MPGRHSSREGEDTQSLHEVLADEPIVGFHLRRRLRIVLIFAVVTLVLTNLAGYVVGQASARSAYRAANRHTDARIKALEEDLTQRRAARAQMDARQQAAYDQLRRDACVLADRIQPRDAAVQAMRARYGCNGTATPSPTPSPSPGATPGGTSPGGTPAPRTTARGQAGPPPRSPGRTVGPPKPTPNPPPTTPPPRPTPPPPPPDDGLICLPLIGCIL